MKNIFSPTLQSYSPSRVLVLVFATIITQWESITVEMDQPRWSIKQGVYGKVARVRTASDLGTITLTLPQTASSNMYMAVNEALTSAEFGIDTVIPIAITDLWGGSLHVMPKATIISKPSVTYGKAPASRSWKLRGNITVNSINVRNMITSMSDMLGL